MEKLQPKLRFPEFEGKWEIDKLGEVANISKLAGYEFTKHITYEEIGNIIALRGLNIKNNELDLTDVKYIDNSELKKLERSKLYIDDLMFTYIGTIGQVALIKENDKFYLAPNVSRIRVNQKLILPKYILQFFNNEKFKNNEIAKYVSSSSQPALSMENVRKFKISFPSYPEQTKIASFLTTVDEKIAGLKKQLTLLERYKKGVMQKIFSQELRFKPAPNETSGDENGNAFPDWEEKKLGEISEFYSGGTPLTTKKDFYDGDIPFIKSGEINSAITNQFISELGLRNSSAKMVSKGDVLFAMYGATSGEVAISKLDGAINQAVLCIKSELNNTFLYNFLLHNKSSIINTYIQGGQGNLSSNIVKSLLITFPSLPEQQKIASFLSSIDEKLEKSKGQIKAMENWKKGLLQQMFV
jgi:type I restriction enzyme S subunit